MHHGEAITPEKHYFRKETEKEMEELKHGSEEMTQYIITTNSGKQVRLFVSAEDWKDECLVMHDIIQFVDCEKIERYSVETVTVE